MFLNKLGSARPNAAFQGLAYILISGFCLVLHNVIMIVADLTGVVLLAGTTISFLITGLFGYLLHSRFTFAAPVSLESLLRYHMVMLPNLPVSTSLLWLLTDAFGWGMLIAAPVGTLIMLALNFFGSRWALARAPLR